MMTNNIVAFLMVFTGYLGIFFSVIFVLTGVDFGVTAQFAFFSLLSIWLGKQIDRALSASKPLSK